MYDFSSLQYNPEFESPPEYTITGSDGYTYNINFCDNVSFLLGGCNPGDVESAVCQEVQANSFIPSGQVDDVIVVPFIRM